MTFRRSLILALVIQSIGSLSTALVSVIISRRFGPTSQGTFASMRSWIDLVTQMIVIGFPQALTYALSASIVPLDNLRTFTSLYCAAIVVVSGIVAFALGHAEAAITVAVAAYAVQCLCRPLVLHERSSVTFNLVSILPSVLMTISAFVIPIASRIWLATALAVSFVSAAVIISSIVGYRKLLSSFALPSLKAVKLLSEYSVWSGLIVVIIPATTVGTYESLRGLPNGQSMIGVFSIPVLLTNAAALPLTMIGPLLFQRWARDYANSQSGNGVIAASHFSALMACAATPVFMVLIWKALPLVFGSRFTAAVGPSLVMGAGAYFFVQSKVLATVLLSLNVPRAYAMFTAARTAAIFAALWCGLRMHLLGVACAWLLGDVVFTFLAARQVAQLLNVPVIAALGLEPAGLLQAGASLRQMVAPYFAKFKAQAHAGTAVR